MPQQKQCSANAVTWPLIYGIAIAVAFWSQWVSLGLYVLVALIWLVPDRRIEALLVSIEK